MAPGYDMMAREALERGMCAWCTYHGPFAGSPRCYTVALHQRECLHRYLLQRYPGFAPIPTDKAPPGGGTLVREVCDALQVRALRETVEHDPETAADPWTWFLQAPVPGAQGGHSIAWGWWVRPLALWAWSAGVSRGRQPWRAWMEDPVRHQRAHHVAVLGGAAAVEAWIRAESE